MSAPSPLTCRWLGSASLLYQLPERTAVGRLGPYRVLMTVAVSAIGPIDGIEAWGLHSLLIITLVYPCPRSRYDFRHKARALPLANSKQFRGSSTGVGMAVRMSRILVAVLALDFLLV